MRSRRSHRISTRGPPAATQRRRKGPSTCWKRKRKRSLRFEASPARFRPRPVRAVVATGTAYYKRQGRTGHGNRKACSDRTTTTRTRAPPRVRARAPPTTTTAPQRADGEEGAGAPRSSRTEMRGGSRPTPAAVFFLAAAGICAQFAAGLRSRSACRPSDLGGAA